MAEPGLFTAFIAGLLSFLSPCVIPLVPGYISFISGETVARLSGIGLQENPGSPIPEHGKKSTSRATDSSVKYLRKDTDIPGNPRTKIITRSILFILGFTVAFTVLGMIFSGTAMIAGNRIMEKLTIASGILVIIFGISTLTGAIPFLQREFRFHLKGKKNAQGNLEVTGPSGAFLLGVAFAIGWSPCIGPVLGSILLFAARNADPVSAAGLLLGYSAGLALPFLIFSIFLSRLGAFTSFLKKKANTTRIISGIFLVTLGIMMALGNMSNLASLGPRLGSEIRMLQETGSTLLEIIAISIAILPLMLYLIVFQKTIRNDPRTALKRHPLILALCVLSSFAGILQVVNIINIPDILVRWLEFSGI